MIGKCLIISPYFPPSSLAGVHRARHLVTHLASSGWNPTVLCVDERDYEEAGDPELFSLVPGSAEILRVRALPARLTRIIGIGEVSLRAFWRLRRAALKLLRSGAFDAVLITGGPFYPMLLSGVIQKKFQIPVVLDFQDPWVSAWGAKQKHLSKAGLSHALAEVLEPRAVRRSSWVTSVSDVQNRQMAQRYNWLDADRMSAIPIGSDPSDFHHLRQTNAARADRWLAADHINLSYVGTFLPEAAPLVRILFAALASLRAEVPELVARLRLNFIGTSNQPDGVGRYFVAPLADEAGVSDLVAETPERIPYIDALGVLAHSDGILMIGSTEEHYTASKIYPGLMSGKPFLSIFHRASSAHEILSMAGGGVALSFPDDAGLKNLGPRIGDGLHQLIANPESLGKPDPQRYEAFTARAIAARFGAIFTDLTSFSEPKYMGPLS